MMNSDYFVAETELDASVGKCFVTLQSDSEKRRYRFHLKTSSDIIKDRTKNGPSFIYLLAIPYFLAN